MNFISTILPGIRDMRTPFAVGGLLVATLLLAATPFFDELAALNLTRTVETLINMLPIAANSASALFLIYLIGILAHGLFRAVFSPRALSKLARFVVAKKVPYAEQLERLLVRPNPETELLLQSDIREKLASVNSVLASWVPVRLILLEFELASLKLSKDSPEQYQRYDRNSAEAEFRTSIAIPVLFLGCTLCFLLPMWLGLTLLAVSFCAFLGLIYQGLRLHQVADELLASSIYFDLSSTPMYDNLLFSAKADRELLARSRPPEVVAWLCDFLAERGEMADYTGIVSRLKHPSNALAGFSDEVFLEAGQKARWQLAKCFGNRGETLLEMAEERDSGQQKKDEDAS